MKTAICSVTCVVALLVAGPVAVPATTVSQEAAAQSADKSDKSLDRQVEQRLKNAPSLRRYHIDVSVVGGVATLTGTVATEAEKTRAGRLAKVNGITRVDNQIQVDPSAGTKGTMGKIGEKTKEGAEKTKEGAEKIGEKTKEGVEKVAEKTKEGLNKAGEEITEAWITTRVKSRFIGEDLLKGSDISVETNKHTVTLKGTVPSAAARARAVEIAKTTEGVNSVVDLLTIAPKR